MVNYPATPLGPTSQGVELLAEQQDNIRSVQSILTAISKFDPGGHTSRLADIAEKQLEEIHTALDRLEVR